MDVAVSLWEALASQVISVVGEGGFDSLFSRSVFLGQSEFPWLAEIAHFPKTAGRFEPLQTCLKKQTTALADAANSQLLVSFIGIIASIIGDQLTMSILRLAWGNEVMDAVNKEFKNE